MNIKFLLTLSALLLSINVFSQTIKEDNIDFNQLYFAYKSQNAHLTDLKITNVVDIIGNPYKIKSEKWETSNANIVKTYMYNNGNVVFEDSKLSFIDINKSGWALKLKTNGKYSKALTVGTDANELKTLFPKSWANKKENALVVYIKNADKSIIFKILNSKIKSISLFSDES